MRFSMIILTAYLSTLISGTFNLYTLVYIIGFLCSSRMRFPEAYHFLCVTQDRTGM